MATTTSQQQPSSELTTLLDTLRPAARAALVWLRQRGWLIVGLLSLSVGYMIVWQRGMHFDDYWLQGAPISFTELMFSGSRFLFSFTSTALLDLVPQNEFLLRLLLTANIGLNAWLLGWFVARLLKSRLAGVIGGWLYLMPIFAAEALLFSGAATGYVPMVTFGLLTLHCFHRSLTQPAQTRRWLLIGVVMFTAAFNFIEQVAGIVVLLPLITLIAAQDSALNRRRLARLTAITLVSFGVILLAHYLLFYRGNTDINQMRGGLDLNPVGVINRAVNSYFAPLAFTTIAPEYGLLVVRDSLALGLETLRASLSALAQMVLAGLLLLWTIIMWRRDAHTDHPPRRVGWIVLGMGLIWFGFLLVFPGALFDGQAVTSRLLYLPLAGLALGTAAIAWLIVRSVRVPLLERLLIALAGLVLILSTIAMLGFTRAYQARSALDQQQATAFLGAVPGDALPADTYIVPYNLDERVLREHDFLNRLQVGLFENTSAALGTLIPAYDRSDFVVVVSDRWVGGTRFDCTTPAELDGGNLCLIGTTHRFRGNVYVPINQMLLFTYREQTLFIIGGLRLAIGEDIYAADLPLAQIFRERGVPVIEHISVDLAAEIDLSQMPEVR
ncbi:MAG: glycosyltransferase family 39 protein [Chloroflexi bacterium]|nr:glycosyltransferase family 39 protein [Chloroflexota bacterium]